MAKKKLYMVSVAVTEEYTFEVEASSEKQAEKAAKTAIEDDDAGDPESQEVEIVNIYESDEGNSDYN